MKDFNNSGIDDLDLLNDDEDNLLSDNLIGGNDNDALDMKISMVEFREADNLLMQSDVALDIMDL